MKWRGGAAGRGAHNHMEAGRQTKMHAWRGRDCAPVPLCLVPSWGLIGRASPAVAALAPSNVCCRGTCLCQHCLLLEFDRVGAGGGVLLRLEVVYRKAKLA